MTSRKAITASFTCSQALELLYLAEQDISLHERWDVDSGNMYGEELRRVRAKVAGLKVLAQAIRETFLQEEEGE